MTPAERARQVAHDILPPGAPLDWAPIQELIRLVEGQIRLAELAMRERAAMVVATNAHHARTETGPVLGQCELVRAIRALQPTPWSDYILLEGGPEVNEVALRDENGDCWLQVEALTTPGAYYVRVGDSAWSYDPAAQRLEPA